MTTFSLHSLTQIQAAVKANPALAADAEAEIRARLARNGLTEGKRRKLDRALADLLGTGNVDARAAYHAMPVTPKAVKAARAKAAKAAVAKAHEPTPAQLAGDIADIKATLAAMAAFFRA